MNIVRITQIKPILRITLNENRVLHIKSVGPQGIPGVQGPPGPPGAAVIQGVSAELISSLSVIFFDAGGARVASGLVFNEVSGAVGIAVTAAANPGDLFNYQVSGELEDGSWSWNPGASLFLSDTGVLSETPGSNLRIIATATTPTKISINLLVPVRR